MSSDGGVNASDLMVAEYERLKDEQRQRINVRDNLVYATLAANAAVVAAALQAHGHANLLLLLAPVSVALGWTYLVNDDKVSAIGRYIRTDLTPRLSGLAGDSTVIFGWEPAHRQDKRRSTRKYLQLAADLSIFCLPPVAAIVIYLVNGPWTAAFITISVLEAAAVILLAAQIVSYADLSGT